MTVGTGPTATARACAFFPVAAAAGDTVHISFTNKIQVYTWAANITDGSFGTGSTKPGAGTNGGGVEVHRGALTYALRPNATVTESTIGCIGGSPEGRYGWNCSTTDLEFPAIKSRNLAVTTAPDSGGNWSYGLIGTGAALASSLQFVGGGTVTAGLPFSAEAPPPLKIIAKARNLNLGAAKLWQNVGVLPHSPMAPPSDGSAPVEDIELVPFGMTNIRVSVFPTLTN